MDESFIKNTNLLNSNPGRNEDIDTRMFDTSLNKIEIVPKFDNESEVSEEEKKEEIETKEKIKNEKLSSVPSMMRCFICKDFCEDGVQILCCNEIFCKTHIIEEIMKNFTCPNCHEGTSLKNIIENKKLNENIQWYKNLLKEPMVTNHPNLNQFLPQATKTPIPTTTITTPNKVDPSIKPNEIKPDIIKPDEGGNTVVSPQGVTPSKIDEVKQNESRPQTDAKTDKKEEIPINPAMKMMPIPGAMPNAIPGAMPGGIAGLPLMQNQQMMFLMAQFQKMKQENEALQAKLKEKNESKKEESSDDSSEDSDDSDKDKKKRSRERSR